MQHIIFVYGTLKRGHGNHSLLEASEFLGTDEAPGVVYGPFPLAQPTPDVNSWIRGEVYAVDDETLRRLDRLEGHPHNYLRTAVQLRSGREAEIYYWPHKMGSFSRAYYKCQDGVWR